MMTTRNKTIWKIVLLGVVDMFFPVPILALILLYVVVERPPWFPKLVREIYGSELEP